MTEKPDQSQKEPITSKMHDLLGCMCVVTLKLEGDRRGVIEQIESLTMLKDFPESFEESQFSVRLTSGDMVVVPGSAITEIESTVVARRSAPIRKKAAIGARSARTKTKRTLDGKRRSITRKVSNAGGKPRARRGKAQARKARQKNGRRGSNGP
jgi:hypothetical protein